MLALAAGGRGCLWVQWPHRVFWRWTNTWPSWRSTKSYTVYSDTST